MDLTEEKGIRVREAGGGQIDSEYPEGTKHAGRSKAAVSHGNSGFEQEHRKAGKSKSLTQKSGPWPFSLE